MNTLIAIHPYKAKGLWVFDDPEVGLRQEPFVSGADAIIDRMVREIPYAELGFTLVFSAQPFLGIKLSSSGDAKSSAEIGTTALRWKWRAGFVRLSSNTLIQPQRRSMPSSVPKQTNNRLMVNAA
jgi:hypothetical protein